MTALPPTALPPAPTPAPTDYRVREALAAHARGWVLMPLRGKIPILDAWQKQLRPPEVDVERWARQGNVGLRTGAISQVVVLDVDTVKGGVVPEDLPSTPTVITGSGGYHYYFRAPAHPMRNSAGRIAPHVDFRAEGGQVVFPGSIHPDTGKPYLWAVSPDDCELAELPEWIVEKLVEPKGYAAAALRNELARVTNAREGERNDTLYRAAFSLGTLVGGGQLDETSVSQALTNATSLPIAEAAATIRSGLTAGKLKPRQPPTKPSAVLVPGAHIDDKGVYVEVGNHQFAEAVIAALPPGEIYRRMGVPGELVGDPGRRSFVPLLNDRLRILVDRHVRLGRWVQKRGQDTTSLAFLPCSRDWAGLILAGCETDPRIREIDILTSYPIFTKHGRAQPGWHEGVYYDEPPMLADIAPDPTNAREILMDLTIDFPFATESDRENYFGLLLTPILRPRINGNIPLHLIMASLERTGKSKLAEIVLGNIILGRPTPAMQLTGSDEERDKRVLAMLLQGDTLIHLDNLRDFVDSAVLASLLTAREYRGRLLSKNTMASVANRVTIVATGNNVRATGEIAKRMIPIILQPRTDEPERRTDIVHGDLPEYVQAVRPRVLAALLGMVEAWIAAGSPPCPERLGGFEEWMDTVGAVLQFHGFTEWGKNFRSWQRQADPDGSDLKTFSDAWWVEFGDRPVSASDLYGIVDRLGLFQWVAAKSKTAHGAVLAFTRGVLARNVNRPVGESIIRQCQQMGHTRYHLDRSSLFDGNGLH